MTQSAFKTLLLIVGSALGGIVVFVAAIATLAYYGDFPLRNVVFGDRPTRTVSRAPDIAKRARYEGVSGMWTGEYSKNRDTVLAAGPGQLVGTVTSGGAAVQGVRLRLMLNGSVRSQWGESDAQGKYTIAVPYDTYLIDGFEIDREAADVALAGKIDNPRNVHQGNAAPASAERPGRALNLDFIDPVRKSVPLGEVSRGTPIVVAWEPYPGTSGYRVRLLEWKEWGSATAATDVFDRAPVLKEPSFNPAEHDVELHKGSYYSLTIDAIDGNGRTISSAPATSTWGRPDFRVVD